jgi:hypothetical protein
MTDQITVDFNSRDAQGFVPASRRRLATLPDVGSIISAIDHEENRCLARVIAVGPASITLEPLWQTFATPEQSGVATDPTLSEGVARASLKAALASMPDVGTDEDFEFERDLPRRSKPA